MLRSLLAPLGAGATYRRYVHLLLGAVLLLPYAGLAALFAMSVRSGGTEPLVLVPLVVVAVLGGVGVALVPGVRSLEISAARGLLDARVPDPDPATVDAWPARVRAGAWLLVNVLAGSAAALLTLIAVPWAVGLVLAPWVAFAPFPTGPGAAWTPLVGLAIPVALLHVVSAGGAALARLAPRLLGPSTAERLVVELAAARRTERALAHRNRLARELHDSVGHALTVIALQAGAAGRVLESDPAFAARALDAIADAGRAALEDLDHVLGVLRDDMPRDDVPRDDTEPDRPQADLRDLDGLLDGARSAGVTVAAEVEGAPGPVPPALSREAYRIVQEGLTNALRHAGPVPVSVRVRIGVDAVELELTNPLGGPVERGPGGGRGLAGLRERVAVLHGELDAGPGPGIWRVHARLPLTPP